MSRPDLRLEDHVVVNESVMARELDGETVLLDLDSGIYFGLDRIGTRIWQLLPAGSLESVLDILTREYDADRATLTRDLLAFLAKLEFKGLITRADSR